MEKKRILQIGIKSDGDFFDEIKALANQIDEGQLPGILHGWVCFDTVASSRENLTPERLRILAKLSQIGLARIDSLAEQLGRCYDVYDDIEALYDWAWWKKTYMGVVSYQGMKSIAPPLKWIRKVMNKLAWATDIHFNFVRLEKCQEFCATVNNLGVDALLIGGDIGEATNIEFYLRFLADNLQVPIYFVLGNHDYYRGSIAEVRSRISGLCKGTNKLIWLPEAGVVRLSKETCLVGHDGWADGRLGDFLGSRVMLNDYNLIAELRGLSPEERLDRLHALGDEAADHFMKVLPAALAQFNHVIVLTHAPPFRGACWHEGAISNDEYLPHFSCMAVGEVLRGQMMGCDAQMTVLCGHSHSRGLVRILPNLLVMTGKAVYGEPEVNDIIEIE